MFPLCVCFLLYFFDRSLLVMAVTATTEVLRSITPWCTECISWRSSCPWSWWSPASTKCIAIYCCLPLNHVESTVQCSELRNSGTEVIVYSYIIWVYLASILHPKVAKVTKGQPQGQGSTEVAGDFWTCEEEAMAGNHDHALSCGHVCSPFSIWLVDWTFSIFPYIGNHPNWLSCFLEGLKPPTRHSAPPLAWSTISATWETGRAMYWRATYCGLLGSLGTS